MNKGGRNRDAIWEKFFRIEKDGKVYAKCKKCERVQSNKAGRMRRHVESCLPEIATDKKRQAEDIRNYCSPNPSREDESAPGSKPARIEEESEFNIVIPSARMEDELQSNNVITSAKKQDIDIMLAKFFLECDMPSSMIKDEYFMNFLKELNPTYNLPTQAELKGLMASIQKEH